MVFISTDAVTSFFTSLPARNYTGGRGGGGGGSIWVVLLHHCIHTYKIMFLQHLEQQKYTSYNIKP